MTKLKKKLLFEAEFHQLSNEPKMCAINEGLGGIGFLSKKVDNLKISKF